MPHQCTTCGKVFADGSKEMLSGCPACGGNKFQFQPKSAVDAPNSESSTSSNSVESSATEARTGTTAEPGTETTAESGTQTTDSLGSGTREWPDTAKRPEDRTTADVRSRDTSAEAPSSPTADAPSSSTPEPPTRREEALDPAPATDGEDEAQASARSDFVSREELSAAAQHPPPQEDLPTGDDERPSAPADADDAADAHEDEIHPDLAELRAELNEQFESIKIVNPGEYELNLMELYDREEYIISLQEDGRYMIEVPESWRSSPEE